MNRWIRASGRMETDPQRSTWTAQAVFVAAAVTSALATACGGGSDHSALRQLATTVGEHRVIQPRLTGGFLHTACEAESNPARLVNGLICRGPPADISTRSSELQRFAKRTRAATASGASAETHHTLGSWNLLWPDIAGSVEKAVSQLRIATAGDTKNARAQSDLAAALLVTAETDQNPGHFVEALEMADRAIALDSSLQEAWFNRSLALERLYLETEAVASWQVYVDLDSRSAWGVEASAHLDRLKRSSEADSWPEERGKLELAALSGDSETVEEIVRRFPRKSRLRIFDETLPGWARAHLDSSHHIADSLLRIAERVSDGLASVTGNALLADAIEAIYQASAHRLQALGDGHIALAGGVARYNRSEYAAAQEELALAEKLLGSAQTPVRSWATYYMALVSYQRTAYEESLSRFASIRRRITPQRYPVLWAQVAHMRGLIHEIRGDHQAAYAARRSALEVPSGTGEVGFMARQQESLARLSSILYGDRQAWRHLYRALEYMADITDTRQRVAVFGYTAQHLSGTAPDIALHFQNAAVRAAVASANPQMISSALRTRAELFLRAGDINRAQDDVRHAERYADGISDDGIRELTKADLQLASGEVNGRHDPAKALRALRTAVDVFLRTEYHFKLPRAHVAVARAYLAQGRYEPADSAFTLAIHEMERQRGSVVEYTQRIQFQDKARPVFDEMVAFQAQRGNPDVAWAVIRRADPHSRTLPSRIAATFSVSPTSRTSCPPALNNMAEVRATTRSPVTFANAVVRSSVMPSQRASPAGPPMLVNGRTTSVLSGGFSRSSTIVRSSSTKARVVSKRSSGAFAKARVTAAQTRRPTLGRSWESGTAFSAMCWPMTFRSSRPLNGGRSASIS